MNKRMFLKLSTAILSAFSGGRLFGKGSDDSATDGQLANWAGNTRYSTNHVHALRSADEVRKFVKEHDFLKVLGTRHCFNAIADSTHALISLKPMDQVIALDSSARTVTVGAGMTYGQLCPYLHEKGFALHNLASLPHISVVGACATATHGSGVNNGNLATAVSAIEVVTANGDVLTLSRDKDGDKFLGSVVNLGALGVVTKVTLDVQSTFVMRQDVYEDLPLAQVADHFESIMSSGYSVSLFTDWLNKRINEVWIKRRIEKGDAHDSNAEYYGARLATKNLHPIAELSAENCTEQMGVPGAWHERLPHFRMGFTPSSGKELQSEYFVSRQNAVEAILAIERLRDHVSPHLLISELRTIGRGPIVDESLLQSAQSRDPFHLETRLGFGTSGAADDREGAAHYQARPHWGKLFTLAPTQLQDRYEKLPDFKNLLKEHDPGGKFRNDFLTKALYG